MAQLLDEQLQVHLEPEASEHNTRNGYSAKTVQRELGQIPLQVPRERQSTFEPVLVLKGQRRLAGTNNVVTQLG